jgi:hypothetical protein
MRSIYELALGDKFNLLHPRIQERFGFSSKDKRGSVGRGVMDKVWRGKFFTRPFLYVGSWRRIMFPERGTAIPFTVRNYAYLDPFGRETVTWVRNFETRTSRRFDAYMIYSQQRGCIVDYLGTHEHLAVDIHLSVDDQGGLCLRSGEQRFYERLVGFRFPMAFSGIADACEWFEDSDQSRAKRPTRDLHILKQLFPRIFRIQLCQFAEEFLRLLISWHGDGDLHFDDFISARAFLRR